MTYLTTYCATHLDELKIKLERKLRKKNDTKEIDGECTKRKANFQYVKKEDNIQQVYDSYLKKLDEPKR